MKHFKYLPVLFFALKLLESIGQLKAERNCYAEQIQEEGRVWKDKTEQLLAQVMEWNCFCFVCFLQYVRSIEFSRNTEAAGVDLCSCEGVPGRRGEGSKHQPSSGAGGRRFRAEELCRLEA